MWRSVTHSSVVGDCMSVLQAGLVSALAASDLKRGAVIGNIVNSIRLSLTHEVSGHNSFNLLHPK